VDAAIKNIDRQLKDARIFRRIARAVKPQNSVTLTKVVIVTITSHLHPVAGNVIENTTIKVIDTRKALEDAIARNKEHFAQADGTPSTRSPLSRICSVNGYNVFEDAEAGRSDYPTLPSSRPPPSWNSFENASRTQAHHGLTSFPSMNSSPAYFIGRRRRLLPPAGAT
jgi:hypothetical protein